MIQGACRVGEAKLPVFSLSEERSKAFDPRLNHVVLSGS